MVEQTVPVQTGWRQLHAAEMQLLQVAAFERLNYHFSRIHRHSDQKVLDTARELAALWELQATRGAEMPDRGSIAEPNTQLAAVALPSLRFLSDLRASTLLGHRARAACILASDSALVSRTINPKDHACRLILALLIDLVESGPSLDDRPYSTSLMARLAEVRGRPNLLAKMMDKQLWDTS